MADVLRDRGLNVNALDVKPASTDSSKKEILNGIKESDFVILLIGDRYGSILPSMTGNDTQSITWWEYNYAHFNRKPILAFIKNCTGISPLEHDSPEDSQYSLKRMRLKRFKERIVSGHNPLYFETSSELANQVEKSLISVYRAGVLKLLVRNKELLNKNSILEKEVSTLKSQLAADTPAPHQYGAGLLSGVNLSDGNKGIVNSLLSHAGLNDAVTGTGAIEKYSNPLLHGLSDINK